MLGPPRRAARIRAKSSTVSTSHPLWRPAGRTRGLSYGVFLFSAEVCSFPTLITILPLAKSLGVGTVCFKTFGAGKLVGDTTGYNQPLKTRPRGKVSSGGSDEAGTLLPR